MLLRQCFVAFFAFLFSVAHADTNTSWRIFLAEHEHVHPVSTLSSDKWWEAAQINLSGKLLDHSDWGGDLSLQLPIEIYPSSSILSIDLSDNDLDSLSPFSRLSKAKEINVSYNQLQSLNDFACLGGDPLRVDCIPVSYRSHGHLSRFEASHNPLAQVDGLRFITHISDKLDVSYGELSSLYGLRCLGAKGDFLKDDCGGSALAISKRLFGEINVSHNQLDDLNEFKHIVSIRRFDASHNQLRHILGLNCLGGAGDYRIPSCGGPGFSGRSIEAIDVSHNYIDKLDPLSKIYRINEINVSYNRLRDLFGLHCLGGVGNHQDSDCGGPSDIQLDRVIKGSFNASFNDLINIDPLSYILFINAIELSHNPHLSSLYGLRCLASSGYTELRDCGSHASPSFRQIDKIDLSYTAITALDELNHVQRIKTALFLNNSDLINIDGLINLTSAGKGARYFPRRIHVDGHYDPVVIDLSDTPKLDDIAGLANLKNTNNKWMVIDDKAFSSKPSLQSPFCQSILSGRVKVAITNEDGTSPLAEISNVCNDSNMTLQFDLGLTADRTITLPLSGDYAATIDWGNKQANQSCPRYIEGSGDSAVSCSSYPPDSKLIRVRISGFLTHYGQTKTSFAQTNLIAVKSFGDLKLQSLRYAFYGAKHLVSVPKTLPKGILSLKGAFMKASSFNGDLRLWDTSQVTDFSEMFAYALLFNRDIGWWSTNNGMIFTAMFAYAEQFNQNLSRWTMRKAQAIDNMFLYAKAFNQPITLWEPANLHIMDGLFMGSAFNQPVSHISIGDLTSLKNVFRDTPFNHPLLWDVSSIRDFSGMLANTPFSQDIRHWKTVNALYMQEMLLNTPNFKADLYCWNVINVINHSQFSKGSGLKSSFAPRWNSTGCSS